MKNELVEQTILLTQESLYYFWKGEADFVLQYLAEDVTWIGAVQYQYMQGLEKVKKDFYDILKEQQICHLTNQEFSVAQNVGSSCTIVGRYLVTSDDPEQCAVRAQQRCIFIWELIGGQLKIKLINVSNPIGELKILPNEKFVNTVGRFTSKYVEQKIKYMVEKKRIVLPDVTGATRFIQESEILYMIADRKETVLYTSNGELAVKKSISGILTQTSPDIMQIHRSYAVNVNYITMIKKYMVVMADNREIPIPEKRYDEIREQISSIHG